MSDEKIAAISRIGVLQQEIATLSDDINYYIDTLGRDGDEHIANLCNARDAAWIEMGTLCTLVGLPLVDVDTILMEWNTDWDSMAQDGREADYYADAAGL
jgi:hypothetical protein